MTPADGSWRPGDQRPPGPAIGRALEPAFRRAWLASFWDACARCSGQSVAGECHENHYDKRKRYVHTGDQASSHLPAGPSQARAGLLVVSEFRWQVAESSTQDSSGASRVGFSHLIASPPARTTAPPSTWPFEGTGLRSDRWRGPNRDCGDIGDVWPCFNT
jgi:hypothetical protein